jgi:hypothetical protein
MLCCNAVKMLAYPLGILLLLLLLQASTYGMSTSQRARWWC